MLIAFIILKTIIDNVSPVIMEYSKSEMKKVAATLINKAITNDILEEMNLDELFIIDKSMMKKLLQLCLIQVLLIGQLPEQRMRLRIT